MTDPAQRIRHHRLHIGVDLAWGARARTGVAAVAADGRLLSSVTLRNDDQIVEWIAGRPEPLGVVAFDAPIVVPNQAGRRPCESQLAAAFGRYDAGPHSANRGMPHLDPPRAATLAGRLGLPDDPAGPRDRVAIEVYPHPAMVGLWGLGRILQYKRRTRHPLAHRQAAFVRLLELIAGEASLRAADVPRFRELAAIAESAERHADLSRIEDEVDGIVCGWLAWLWAVGDGRLRVWGDAVDGYIVAPHAPTHPTTPRAPRASHAAGPRAHHPG